MAYSGCAAGKGMVFVLSILNRVYKFARVYNLCKSVLNNVHDWCELDRVCSNYKQGVGP